uniref:Uncharacterized protein n=1 Tax=Kalanchoe fedtschenkoi TaxID=63787 RepID=A0A7N0ZWW2_KALFE
MASFIYHVFTSTAMLSLGLYHLIVTTRNHLKSPREYSAKPYHPFPSSSAAGARRYLQLYLIIACLFIAFLHQTLISADPDPLLKGRTPVHRFTSLQSAAVLFLFLLLSLSLLLSETTSLLPFPPDLFFGVASALFYLHYSSSSAAAAVQISGLQAKCDSVSAIISALASLLCFILACQPRLFVADVGLGAALLLQGLWALQTGLSLYVEAFIPEGCHKMLDVVSGVEGSTKCDLEESKLRAAAILDLAFVIHVLFVLLIVFLIYGLIAKTVSIRRSFGSYEALPTLTTAAVGVEPNHIQMKSLTGTQA